MCLFLLYKKCIIFFVFYGFILCITLGDNQHNYYLLAREKFMPRFLCDGWTLENRLEQPIDYLCNDCIPWSWKEGDENKSTMREILENLNY